MMKIQKSALAAMVMALALGAQAPRFVRADAPVNPSAAVVSASLSGLARLAIDADPSVSKPAIEKLRAAGPAGLDALLDANQAQVNKHRIEIFAFSSKAPDPTWPRVTAALDAVAAQRNAYASGLYWYTDLSAAEAAARASGKPILSLRLLGNLRDEYSCANSRFFRTVLYANTDVSKYLREHFILHWQSVRPVPVITIDFGDGRVIRRTITGNSIHYVLTPEGQVVDGIPGLYGAKAFLRELGEAERAVASIGGSSPHDQTAWLARYHAYELSQIDESFQNDLRQASIVAAQCPATAKTEPASLGS